MNETPITIVGRLTADPDLRFTGSGDAVANFTIASNARKFDKRTNEWKDEPAAFWRCSVWRDMAGNVAESLTRGMAVVATGTIRSNVFTDKETGKERHSLDVDVQAIGPDLRWATAKVNKTDRTGQAKAQGGWGAQQQSDPWATSSTQGNQQAGGFDETPF